MKSVLYLLPHHDDEVFVIPKIREDLRNGHDVCFFYFMSSEKRFRETCQFLGLLGVSAENIVSVGSLFCSVDGNLLASLPQFYSEMHSILNRRIQAQSQPSTLEFVTTALEGGHQDHDAISLLTRALARDFQGLVLEFFLYNGYKTTGKNYRVSYPILTDWDKISSYQYNICDLKVLFFAPFIFKSQIKAMAGLWPFLLWKALSGDLVLRLLEGNFLTNLKFKDDSPMYERWGRTTLKQFKETVSRFPFLR